MKRIITQIIILAGMIFCLSLMQAQENETQKDSDTPIVISFVPGINFPFDQSGTVNLAFGILISSVDSLNGIQISSLISMTDEIYSGIQVSGIMNLATDMDGMQYAGVINLSGDLKGIQGSGVLNLSGTLDGLQVSGVINMADDVKGVQISGVMNLADNVNGLMISLVNVCDQFSGLQLGLVNISGDSDGPKIGLLNIAGEAKGPMIGLINISENGITELTLRYVSDGTVFAGYKSGTNLFFAEVEAGTNYEMTKQGIWNVISSASIGTRLEIKPVYVDFQLGTLNAFGQFGFGGFLLDSRITAGIKIGNQLSIHGGVSANSANLIPAEMFFPLTSASNRVELDLPFLGPFRVYPKWFVGIAL